MKHESIFPVSVQSVKKNIKKNLFPEKRLEMHWRRAILIHKSLSTYPGFSKRGITRNSPVFCEPNGIETGTL